MIAVVLAAGQGTRMRGVCKALLDAGGRTFLGCVVAAARAAGARPLVVAGGRFQPEVTAAARKLGVEVAVNPDPGRGMSSSIAVGVAAARPTDAGALVWPVDHPAVRPDTVGSVLASASPDNAVVPLHAGQGGHPVWFGRVFFAALRDPGLGDRGGARALLADPRVIRVNVDDPGVRYDIDTPSDYDKMRLP